jgi:thioredoxin reductase (NADPH)
MALTKKEIVIIGGGPAGVAAAIYAKRANKDMVVLEPNLIGGQLTWSSIIENYPGFKKGISGLELAENMKQQLKSLEIEIINSKVTEISAENSTYILKTDKGEIETVAVIVATGALPRKLGIPGEKEFLSKGVSYCATCDAPLFKNKIVAVVGGGDVALEEALYLSEFAKKVYLVHRRQGFRAAAILEQRINANERIELLLDSTLESIEGDNVVKRIQVRSLTDNSTKKIDTDGVFVFIGSEPNSKLVEDMVELDDNKFVIANSAMESSRKGIFAAGDVRKKEYRQVVLACADGAVAALSASKYINENSY